MSRSYTEVANRAASVAGLLTGTTVHVDAKVLGWARAAQSQPGQGVADTPFRYHPEIIAYYEPTSDRLDLHKRKRTFRPATTLSDGTPDTGVGEAAALAIANSTALDLASNGLVGSGEFEGTPRSVVYHRMNEHSSSDPETVFYQWVESFEFKYGQNLSGYYLLDSTLTVTVDRDGALEGIRVAQMEAQYHDTRTAVLDLDGAAQLNEGLAQAEWGTGVAVNRWRHYVGFHLPDGVSQAIEEPKYRAKLSASYMLTEAGETFAGNSLAVMTEVSLRSPPASLQVIFPDPSAQPIAPRQADGDGCINDDHCQSGHCYVVSGIGVCGRCSSDSDCPGGGCQQPNPVTNIGSVCNVGDLGSGCQTSSACNSGLSCEVISAAESVFETRGCSECDKDAACPSGQTCQRAIDALNWSGALECSAPGTRSLGETCRFGTAEGDAVCTSGKCAELDLGFDTFGVCSSCKTDADCPGTDVCSAATYTAQGALHFARCEPA